MADLAADVVLAQEYDKIPQLVMDDLTAFVRGLPLEFQAGGTQVLLQILHRKSAPRRRARKEKRTP
jgi:hypothetical protein